MVRDNVMTCRLNRMNALIASQAPWWGRAQREEAGNRKKSEEVIDFPEMRRIRKASVGRLSHGLKKRVDFATALGREVDAVSGLTDSKCLLADSDQRRELVHEA